MPLPDSAPLSLQVQSNLGNAVQSKPKRAMIVRMSAETLEALEAFPNHPEMSVDFGDNPGIYIGETFFPMRPHKESSPHELYLRAASAAKPMAPLKLYANVIGKFIVERQLGDKVTEKLRQQTMAAKQQHMERKAIPLPEPPIPAPGSKTAKRKMPGSGTVVKKTAASDQLRVPSSSAMAARKVSPLPQNPPSTKASADVRRRLVHCLAISPRLADDAVKMVGGANISSQAREDLLALLEEIAEQQVPARKGDKSPRPWTLKPQTWTEVRPYEWPKCSEAERTAMARQARMAFKALKIPETDPAWDNVRYRQTGPTIPQPVPAPPPVAASSSRSSSSAQAEAKRPAISSKDTKAKAKQDTTRSKGEIQMKDESAKATVSRVNAIKRAEADRTSTLSDAGGSAKTVASRRLPGSGYQAKKSPQPSSGAAEKSATPKPSVPASLPPKPVTTHPPAGGSHARKTIPTMPPKPTNREDDSDKERDREYERVRERERQLREKEKEQERKRKEWEREKERVEMERREADKREKARLKEREEKRKEREREEVEQERRLREKEREKERMAKERASAATGIKRKPATQDPEDASPDPIKAPIPKRRKVDDTPSTTSSSSKARDPGLPKKPVHEPSPLPRLKIKKEPSPLPPPRASSSTTQASTSKSDRSKSNGTTKLRRKSPIYTSSEDEGEIPQPRKRNPSPPPVSDRSTSDQSSDKQPRHRPRASLPTDRAVLRALYESRYSDYLATFTKVVEQRRKIDAVLNGDSDAEADLMETDELLKLSEEHKSLREELEHITDVYTNGTSAGRGSASD